MGHNPAVFSVFRGIEGGNLFFKFLDYFLGNFFSLIQGSNKDKVIASDMPHKIIAVSLFTYRAQHYPGGFSDGLIAVLKSVFVVISLKLIQVQVTDGKEGFLVNVVLELVGDGDISRDRKS